MIHFDVWIVLPDGGTALAGELVCGDADSAGRYQSEFEYAAGWLESPAFPLDPISLPLRSGPFEANKLEPPLSVFEDALPDDWGRQVIIRSLQLPRAQQGEPHLLREMAKHGLALGALRFSEHGGRGPRQVLRNQFDLSELIEAAARFEAGEDDRGHGGSRRLAELRPLFFAGSSLGGARPKAAFSDRTEDWVAKFPSKRDGRFDVVGLEATGLTLAQDAGIQVPDHRIVPLGKFGRALLVRRFDVLPVSGRAHMVSLHTLCQERPGMYALGYRELALAIRKVSISPAEDLRQLFGQMVFNAAYGNVDDHLKNFWMIRGAAGFRLSPAFDLVPDVGHRLEHTLAFLHSYSTPSRADVLEIARQWGVHDAPRIVDAVTNSVRNFPEVASGHGVPDENIAELGGGIERRLALLGSDGRSVNEWQDGET
jgi:serine/threonine-protein kinase HipA